VLPAFRQISGAAIRRQKTAHQLRSGIGGTAGTLLVAASVQLAAAAAADAAPEDPTSGDSGPFAYLETDFDNFVQAENTDIAGLIDLLPDAFTGVVTTTGDAVRTAFTDFGDLEWCLRRLSSSSA